MTITTEIRALPPAPQRTDPPAVFVPKADAHVVALNALVFDINEFAGEANTTQVEINQTQSEVEATQTLTDASAAASAASAASAAAAADFKGEWADLVGALNQPASVQHDGVRWALLEDLADVTAEEPTLVNAKWSIVDSRFMAPKVSSQALALYSTSELQDGSAFPVPLANSVPANWYLDIEQTDTFKAFRPSLTASGGDTFTDGNGSDTTIDFISPTRIRIVSNGVSEWRL